MATLFWFITIAVCIAFLLISVKVKDEASSSFSSFSLGKGSFPFILMFFTYFATIMGAGNFFGHAGNAYEIGVPWLAYIVGEQGAKLLFALVFAGMAGAFAYKTVPEMLNDLVVEDKITRAIVTIMITILLVAMIGGQSKALGLIFAQFTGKSPVPIIIVFSLIFILYTCMGGIYSVIWNDLVQGIMCCVFGLLFYYYAFSKVDFSFTVLGERLNEVGCGDLWSLSSASPFDVANKFFTGCIAILVSQVIWQRCFCSKGPKQAKISLFTSGVLCIVFTLMTAFVGLIIRTLNQNLSANNAMTWFMENDMPKYLILVIFMLILCAGMSTADSALNSCAVVIVNDVILQFRPQSTDKELVNYTKIATIVLGVISCFAGIYAESIYSLIAASNTLGASAMAPLIVIGLLWKKKQCKHEEGKRNSRVTPWGARASLIVGFLAACFPINEEIASLWAALLGSVTLIVVSLITAEKDECGCKEA